MSQRRVTFTPGGGQRVELTLRGPWSVTPGLAPDVNTAVVPAGEFAKLPSNLRACRGTIEFWWSVAPGAGAADHELANVQLVDARPGMIRRLPGDAAPSVVDYELQFADFRHAYVEPRGGRLFNGPVNPDPRPANYTLASNSALIAACATAMGGYAIAAPAGVDAIDPVRGLQWDGAHAATELSKLLQHCGCVYAPHSNGLGSVYQPHVGSVPAWPAGRVASDLTTATGDRRPEQIVLLSSPTAVVLSFDHNASSPPAWQFVIEDPATPGRWIDLGDDPDLAANPADDVRNGFADLPEERRETVSQQLYRVIRLDTSAYPPEVAPILAKVFHGDGAVSEPRLRLAVARNVGTPDAPAYRNLAVDLYAQVDHERGLMFFSERIGTVDTADAPNADAAFVAVSASDLKPTFSVESRRQDGRREIYGRLFAVGDNGAVAGAGNPFSPIDYTVGYRPGVACYCCPELRLIRENGSDANLASVDALAQSLAGGLVPPKGAARRVELVGFLGVELGGRVSGVAYDQQQGKTIVEIDGYAAPAGGGHSLGSIAGGVGSGGGGGGGTMAAPAAAGGASDRPSPIRQPARSGDGAQQRYAPQQRAAAAASSGVSRTPGRPAPARPVSGGPQVVNVTQVGGSAGDAAATCNFTYDVARPGGGVVATGRAPMFVTRIGQMAPGTQGLAILRGADTLLLTVNEQPLLITCSEADQ